MSDITKVITPPIVPKVDTQGAVDASQSPGQKAATAASLEALGRALGNPPGDQPGKPPETPGKPPETPGKPPEAPKDKPGETPPVTLENFDFTPLTQEYLDSGKLSEKSYEDLGKLGLPKTLVDKYIKALGAEVRLSEIEMLEPIGGKKEFTKMAEWAGSNLSPEDIEVMNKGLKDNPQVTLQLLKSRYDSASGVSRPLAGVPGTPVGNPYLSLSELQADMQKPEYQKDPSFRKAVEDRLRVSKI